MLKSNNTQWARYCFPNLPLSLAREYMNLLGCFCDCPVTDVTPRVTANTSWLFPFIDIEDAFDLSGYEEWTAMVEEDMIDWYGLKYGLNHESFSA